MDTQNYLQRIKNKSKSIYVAYKTFFKLLLCAIICGVLMGIIGAYFHHLLTFVTEIRTANLWIILLLPIAGIMIVLLYKSGDSTASKGTNQVIASLRTNEEIPLYMAPMIIISTALTHLCGGSAGREGAALQIGGSIGNFLGKILKLNKDDKKIITMCGMSSCFSALFGTPVTAAIFSIEVVNVGTMHYVALVPCVISALISNKISELTGNHKTIYALGEVPDLSFVLTGKFLVMAIIFACASVLLWFTLIKASKIYGLITKNEYLRVILASVLIIAFTCIFRTTDYLGAGTDVIERSFTTSADWYVFLLKILLTAITLGGGFKGGEIVPTLFVGATLGSFLAPYFGLPVGLCAACGMVSVFCGVTNSPISSLILSVELFGSTCIEHCILCIVVCYFLSGHRGLYSSQRFAQRKFKNVYINNSSNV